MTDFAQVRADLAESNREIVAKTQQALLAREARRKGPLDERSKPSAKERRIAEELSALRERASELAASFATLSDPRNGIAQWSDGRPILLFPLRLETRFKTSASGQPELWVRAYPDVCLVDSFEPSLTDQEVANASRFWAAIWRAGGDETMERTAWRDLVAAHGSGRAGWIVTQYLPLNPGDAPSRNGASDVLLVISSASPLPSAAIDYWSAAWIAGTSAAASAAAFDALVAAVGEDDANDIVATTRPFNFDDAPAAGRARDQVRVVVAVLQLTPAAELQTRRTSWSSPAHVDLLPDRLVLIGYSGATDPLVALGEPIPSSLSVSPDPNAPPEEQLKQDGDTLTIPPAIRWMFDFDEALRVGMAFRIPLPTAFARGFDRLLVLGIRLADSVEESTARLETLLEHHLYSRGGLELLPQGTPTNNTEHNSSGYTFRDDPDASFDPLFKREAAFLLEADALARRDGDWLARLLGIHSDLIQRLPNAGGRDQSEARAMQIALWPGTIGYAMKTLLAPVFSEADIAATRAFFTRYVSGRGPLPVLRVGDQPYGILPTAPFDRLTWFDQRDKPSFASRLYSVLHRIRDDWDVLMGGIRRIGTPGADPHQLLLDVLGLHPTSAEYYPLQGDTAAHKYYEMSFFDAVEAGEFLDLISVVPPLALLQRFGYTGSDVPDLLRQVYRTRQTPLTGPLIDDRPLSERDAIRRYAGTQNYIQWLIDAAGRGAAALQQEQGFDGGVKPTALLYLLLRNATQLAIRETAIVQSANAGVLADVRAARREPAFVHVTQQAASESRYDVLFRPEPRVTGNANELLGDYIARNIRVLEPDLSEYVGALERLALVPTARLERLFAEHIDICSYRLDAWTTGMLTQELERRQSANTKEQPAGVHVGVFGWVEALAPDDRKLATKKLPDDLAAVIDRPGDPPLMTDSANEGLIHAPSLNHATTAAVLRNGYVANDGRLAVNLSSRRVRLALGILDGMRNGQSLGALLGYQFERFLHDNGPLTVHAFIYPLRRAFPLVANLIVDTSTDDEPAREATAAMNVVDGRKLIEAVESVTPPALVYPFGVAALTRGNPAEEQALTDALAYIRDVNDAVADLVIAEGVHQAVLGNYDRSAGTLDAFAKGGFPPEPDVVRTPRSGTALTLRTAIHLAPNPAAPAVGTPLASAERAVNEWLADRLPPPDQIGCNVTFTDRTNDTETTVFVSQDDLELDAIDLVYRLRPNGSNDQALSDLDDRILTFIYATETPRHDRVVRINHTDHVAGSTTWFELEALLVSLRELVVASRPLRPGDVVRHNDALHDDDARVFLDPAIVTDARDDIHDTLLPALATADTTIANAGVTVDDAITAYVDAVTPLAAYRLPQTGIGFAYEWRAAQYDAIVARVAERLDVWDDRRARFQASLDAYDALGPTPEDQRLVMLRDAEIIISTTLMAPPPGGSGPYRLALDTVASAFDAKRDALGDLVDTGRATIAQLLSDAKGELPLDAFDPKPLDFTDIEAEFARFRQQLRDTLALITADTTKRITQVDALLTAHDATAANDERVSLLQKAAKLIFGDDFQLVPSITLSDTTLDAFEAAYQAGSTGALTGHLVAGGRDFPMDDWLHGVARVRDKMRHWENIVLIDDAVRPNAPVELTPMQMPSVAGEPWLGLEIPAAATIDGDRLLYTAHFAKAFVRGDAVRGLLVDEWTEVIPGASEESGIAFHYDRPNCEPPQAWLLALPAARTGAWLWNDLVDGVLDALTSARRRALEPVHLAGTAYSWFLPATTSAYTFPEISISNNLLRNRRIYAEATITRGTP